MSAVECRVLDTGFSTLPRTIIVSGTTENELHGLMSTCKKAGMKNALWAVLTPSSESWTIQELINELAAERMDLGKHKKINFSEVRNGG